MVEVVKRTAMHVPLEKDVPAGMRRLLGSDLCVSDFVTDADLDMQAENWLRDADLDLFDSVERKAVKHLAKLFILHLDLSDEAAELGVQ